MKRRLFIFFLMSIIVLTMTMISAEPSFIYKQNTLVDIKIPVYDSDNSKTSGSTSCYITIKYPDETIFIDDEQMTYNAGGYFNYTLEGLNSLGEYSANMRCDDSVNFGFSTFTFEVTPSGFTGTLGFYILILVLSAGIIILGFTMKDAPITILGSFGLYFVGLYILFYGIDGMKDLITTVSIGIIILGLAGYISIRSAYELIVD